MTSPSAPRRRGLSEQLGQRLDERGDGVGVVSAVEDRQRALRDDLQTPGNSRRRGRIAHGVLAQRDAGGT